MSRLQSALHVYVFAALGVFLVAIPWSPVWDVATAPYLPTAAGTWFKSGFARGFVSGLGGLNLLAAWAEARSILRSLSAGGQNDDPPAGSR